MSEIVFLKGKSLSLRPLLSSDINETYISWLNNPDVNHYSERLFFPTNDLQVQKYIDNLGSDEKVLAICTDDRQHIGNIKFGPINWVHKSAEISILIGDKSKWGKGYGSEAVYLVTKHLFKTLGLQRVHAGTINPAFVKMVEKLGWKQEGVLRKAYLYQGQFIDIVKLSFLAEEFKIKLEYEG